MAIKKISEYPALPSELTTGDDVLVERGGAGYKKDGAGFVNTTGSQTVAGVKSFTNTPVMKAISSTEGGQIDLEKPSGSSLAGNLAVDLLTNTFRVFEAGGTLRGINLDISNARAGIATGIAPAPASGAGLGQWSQISANGATLYLPAGGTWAYIARYVNNTTGVLHAPVITGVGAGGAEVIAATAGYTGIASIWRIA